ncbi:MAG: VOC family protein [Pseudomonadota bacterium]|nr:VOC family protein [Pseudomonadota bacterium]
MNSIRSTVIPSLRYRDAPAAIDWLCAALGFTRQLVVPDENGGVTHAQLRLGGGMIMLGSARDDEWGRRMALPAEIGGRETQCCCLVVQDVETHCIRAQSAGADIVQPLHAPDYGGQAYACRDPEGHVWWIGSYDPWAEVEASEP